MKRLLTLVFVVVTLASCSSAFRSGQTPDDVYYSYGAPAAVKENNDYAEENSDDRYRSYWQGADDNYVRMRVRDRNRWSSIDDLDYWYGYNNPRSMFNNVWINNGFNNPYYAGNFYGGYGWNSFGYNSWNNPWLFNSYYNSWNNPYSWNQPVVIISKYPTAPQSNMRPAYRSAYNNTLFDRGNNNRYGTSNSSSKSSYQSIWRNSGGNNGSMSEGSSRPGRLFDNGSSGTQQRSSTTSPSSSGSSRSTGSGSAPTRPGRGG